MRKNAETLCVNTQLVWVFTSINNAQKQTYRMQRNPPITEPQGTEFFFQLQQVPFRTGTSSLNPRDCKRFPLKTGFRYVHVPFKTGFTV